GARTDLGELQDELAALFPMLADGPGQPHAVALPETRESRTAVFELLARALGRVAGGQRLLLLLENLDAADVSVEALQYAFRRLGVAPVLIVASYETTEVDDQHAVARTLRNF